MQASTQRILIIFAAVAAVGSLGAAGWWLAGADQSSARSFAPVAMPPEPREAPGKSAASAPAPQARTDGPSLDPFTNNPLLPSVPTPGTGAPTLTFATDPASVEPPK